MELDRIAYEKDLVNKKLVEARDKANLAERQIELAAEQERRDQELAMRLAMVLFANLPLIISTQKCVICFPTLGTPCSGWYTYMVMVMVGIHPSFQPWGLIVHPIFLPMFTKNVYSIRSRVCVLYAQSLCRRTQALNPRKP